MFCENKCTCLPETDGSLSSQNDENNGRNNGQNITKEQTINK